MANTVKRTYELKMVNDDVFYTVIEYRPGVNSPNGVGQDISVLLASKYIITVEGHYVFPAAIASIRLSNTEVIKPEVVESEGQDDKQEEE